MTNEFDVSVIMATFNSELTVERAIQSLVKQSSVSWQLIVIDGGSNDTTLVKIRDLVEPNLLISEKDNGIANAWNKALEHVLGKFVIFLNSDDCLPPHYLSQRLAHIQTCAKSTVTYCDTLYIKKSGAEYRVANAGVNYSLSLGFYHTSCLFPKSAFDGFRFNESIRIAIDIDHLFSLVTNNWAFVKSDGFNIMYSEGVSDQNWNLAAWEYYMLYIAYFKPSVFKQGFLAAALAVRCMFRYFSIFELYKYFKKQVWSISISLGNLGFNFTPYSIQHLLFNLSGYNISRSACVAGGVKISAFKKLKIGSQSMINRDVYLDNRGELSIGKQVNIDHGCRIYTMGHDIDHVAFIPKIQPVTIHDKAVLFANSQVMPGVVVGEGAVILGGSVVTKNVQPYTVVGGNPAQYIRDREKDLNYNPVKRYYFAG